MFSMVDMSMLDTNPAAAVNSVATEDVARFLRVTIREKKLTRIVSALNREVLCDDPARRTAAQTALKRIGFV